MEKVIRLLEDEDFITELASIQSKEELRNLLQNNELDLDSEEIESIYRAISGENSDNEVLSVDDLDHISGGSIASIANTILKYIYSNPRRFSPNPIPRLNPGKKRWK